MKFVVAVVMLALAVSVQSSLVGHYAPAVSYVTSAIHPAAGHWGGPWGGAWDGAWDGAWGGHGPAAVAVHAGGPWGHSGPAHWGIPGISLAQGPAHGHLAAPLALAHGHGHGHEGVYVAKTRGAVHTAPLAGHVASATSINVAPAPGTH